MSMAKLNIVITARADACHIDDKEQYYVHITDCVGQPLKWCGKTYTFLPAKCGHLEVDIPPGCYTVFASHTSQIPADKKYQPFGNLLTHVQVVRANCGDHICVTLFAPGMHYCGTWFATAVKQNYGVLEQANIDMNLARTAVTAVENFMAKLAPEPYAANVLRTIEQGPPKK